MENSKSEKEKKPLRNPNKMINNKREHLFVEFYGSDFIFVDPFPVLAQFILTITQEVNISSIIYL